jgi:hypothetical protein
MMAAQSYWSGKKVFWDAKTEAISESMPVGHPATT